MKCSPPTTSLTGRHDTQTAATLSKTKKKELESRINFCHEDNTKTKRRSKNKSRDGSVDLILKAHGK